MKHIKLYENFEFGYHDSISDRDFVRGMKDDFERIRIENDLLYRLVGREMEKIQDDDDFELFQKTFQNTLMVIDEKAAELSSASDKFLQHKGKLSSRERNNFMRLMVKGRDYIFGLMGDINNILTDKFAGGDVNESVIGDVINIVRKAYGKFRAVLKALDSTAEEINSIIKQIESETNI